MTTVEYHQNIRKVWVLANDNSSSLTDTGPLVGDGSFELIFVTGSGYIIFTNSNLGDEFVRLLEVYLMKIAE